MGVEDREDFVPLVVIGAVATSVCCLVGALQYCASRDRRLAEARVGVAERVGNHQLAVGADMQDQAGVVAGPGPRHHPRRGAVHGGGNLQEEFEQERRLRLDAEDGVRTSVGTTAMAINLIQRLRGQLDEADLQAQEAERRAQEAERRAQEAEQRAWDLHDEALALEEQARQVGEENEVLTGVLLNSNLVMGGVDAPPQYVDDSVQDPAIHGQPPAYDVVVEQGGAAAAAPGTNLHHRENLGNGGVLPAIRGSRRGAVAAVADDGDILDPGPEEIDADYDLGDEVPSAAPAARGGLPSIRGRDPHAGRQ